MSRKKRFVHCGNGTWWWVVDIKTGNNVSTGTHHDYRNMTYRSAKRLAKMMNRLVKPDDQLPR